MCYHCGENCEEVAIEVDNKSFCCEGCKTVYGILNKVALCDYYAMNERPGLNQKTATRPEKFAFLDDEVVKEKLIHFKDTAQSHVRFYLPQMHCSSCIWLLEHLTRLNQHIIRSQVNFLKKEVSIVFNHDAISLRKVTELLTSIGYEPHFSLNNLSDKKIKTYDKSRLYKIGIGGFCFSNIMMLSFPEYFSFGNIDEKILQRLFSYLCLGLSLPVFFYCASDFFISAWKSLKQRFLNIDAPIALAIIITFSRSVYEIISGTGSGYLDSMSGIVFFMLLGRFFQDKTYNTLFFNRDYTSYFPLSVTVIEENGEKQVPVSELKTGQRIRVYSQEIIPADCILFLGEAKIDYSFVSGEALPVEKNIGEIVYAGGRQLGAALELEVVKEVSQSYLTQLWNNEAFDKKEEKGVSYIHTVSKYFTVVLFLIAASTALYWYINDVSLVWSTVTAILIVACPCALLLSATFTNGNMLRELQKSGFYGRSASVIEELSQADTIVFDKTGTLTTGEKASVIYQGEPIDDLTLQLISSLAQQSSHPFSKAIAASLPVCKKIKVKEFVELKGAGVQGIINGRSVALGSAEFIGVNQTDTLAPGNVFVKVDNDIKGSYVVQTQYRKGFEEVLIALRKNYKLSLLSGDNNAVEQTLKPLFDGELLFKQSPQDKLDYIRSLRQQGRKVIMVGDGLNDAGALKQSNAGIAITDHVNNFSPACDVILTGETFGYLDLMLAYCRQNKGIINASFVISILYNFVGLYFAVQGLLQPVIAAILMPISSVTIVLLTTGMGSLGAIKLKKAGNKLNSLNKT